MGTSSQKKDVDHGTYPQGGIGVTWSTCLGENEHMPPPPVHESRFLAPAQVAELLHIEVDEVIALVHEGRLRGAQLGVPPRWRVEESSLEGYVAEESETSRRMALWRQSQAASFPEVWGASSAHGS